MRLAAESVSFVAMWPLWAFASSSFFFFQSINLHLKHNIKFRLYKIKIMHVNKLFLYNVMK
jgi:hypothetical protein